MDPAAARLIDAWEKRLSESKFATAKCRMQRIRTDRDVSAAGVKPEIKYDTVLRAQAVMRRDANWLLVWEGEKAPEGSDDRPVLKLQCLDGQVREQLWHEPSKQYHTSRYLAPTAFGANDTKYENGCMIGDVLSTWIGVNSSVELQLSRMRASEISPELVDVNGKWCRVFHYTFPDNRADRSDTRTFYLDTEGRLMRWIGVQRRHEGNIEVEITQKSDYDFAFYDEIPPGGDGPLGANPAGLPARNP